MNQCQKPTGWLGRFVLWNMNSRHSKVTDWGLSNIEVQRQDVILDVGCGGGRTVSKLAAMASEGRVYGIDFPRTSVAVALPHSEHKPAVPMYQYSVGLPHLSQYSGLG